MRENWQEICKNERFLSKNWKKWVVFEYVF